MPSAPTSSNSGSGTSELRDDGFSEVSLPLYHAITAEIIRLIKRVRRSREGFFDPDLFAEPAWDMLLDLYEAQLHQRRVPVNAACIGSRVPPTTALRWLQVLEDKGLICRTPDAKDGRRVFVSLTDAAVGKMDALLAKVGDELSALQLR